MRLLLVIEDKKLSSTLKSALESEYNSVDQTKNQDDGFLLSQQNHYDAIVYDCDNSSSDKSFFCKQIRMSGDHTPIIILSSSTEVKKRVTLLNCGADDFITKPFSFEEFMARLRSLRRRGKATREQILEIDDLVVNVTKHTVVRNEKTIKLTKKEFEILKILLERRGRTVSRKIILESIWDTNAHLQSNTIDLHIHKLRNKLGDSLKNRLIYTVPSIGYVIK